MNELDIFNDAPENITKPFRVVIDKLLPIDIRFKKLLSVPMPIEGIPLVSTN
jgi:hypothetical protein